MLAFGTETVLDAVVEIVDVRLRIEASEGYEIRRSDQRSP